MTARPLEPGSPQAWMRAGCKLNLYLHVNARRPDGYHELQTFFELLDYGDELSVDSRHEDIRVQWVAGDESIEGRPADPQHDLLYKAAARLREESLDVRSAKRPAPGVHVTLRKHVPVGGGLGGGSAAAACLLKMLNQSWGLHLPIDRLAGIGRELGADVPVFIHGRSATAHGVGERLQPGVAGQTSGTYLVLILSLSSPTANLFAADELDRDRPKCPDAELLEHWRELGTNVFEPILLARHPDMAALLADLRAETGFGRVTGSGSSLFAPVTSADEGRRIAEELASRHAILRRHFVARRLSHSRSAT